MSRVHKHTTERRHDQDHHADHTATKADHTITDELLDEIDKVLAECDAEAEKTSFKEKLKSISFGGRARARCEDLVALPRGLGEILGAERYDGPPCVGC